jgi:hypothetical protein
MINRRDEKANKGRWTNLRVDVLFVFFSYLFVCFFKVIVAAQIDLIREIRVLRAKGKVFWL